MSAGMFPIEPSEQPGAFKMRAKCRFDCDCETGYIRTTNGQDCVYCGACHKHQYNAPKTETGRKQRSLSTTHEMITPSIRTRVLLRASRCCELCGKRGDDAMLTVGHLISVEAGHKLGMTDQQINDDENLSCLCAECNSGMSREPMPLRICMGIVMARIAYRQENGK